MEQLADLLEEVVSNIFKAAERGLDGQYITMIRDGLSFFSQKTPIPPILAGLTNLPKTNGTV